MKLSEVKIALQGQEAVRFQLPNGQFVSDHFHVTEVGGIEKNFIDCGGTVRSEKVVNFQLWEAGDYDHRLGANKLLGIIGLSEKVLSLKDADVEVEYQGDTIGKYDLSFSNGVFQLLNKQTDCLAKDKCGIPEEKVKVDLKDVNASEDACCSPTSGCC